MASTTGRGYQNFMHIVGYSGKKNANMVRVVWEAIIA
jgi:hypothetical protein